MFTIPVGPEDGQINYEHCEEWCVLKLGLPGIIQNIVIDTNHFKGNPPDRVKIEGGAQEGKTLIWTEIVPFSRASVAFLLVSNLLCHLSSTSPN